MTDEPRCKWDQEAGEYVADGEVCDVPRKDHCGARRTCAIHLQWGESTCARCVGRTRTDIRQIVERAALMLPEAMVAGVDSEAAMLAGPACDYRVFSARRNLDRRWIMDHLPDRHQERAMRNLLADDDEWHPYSVLTRWAMMLAEDYGLTLPARLDITNAAGFLERVLHRVAQDDEQDYPLLARELRKCRAHMESVLRDSLSPERGAPCPTCSGLGTFVRLTREYAHWCTSEVCERFHYDDDSADVWRCPKNSGHVWDLDAYSRWVEERKAVGA